MRSTVCFLALSFTALGIAATDTPPPSDQQVRDSVLKSVRLLQSVQSQWKQDCFSCHHQMLPVMALQAAREAGVPVDESVASKTDERTFMPAASVDTAVQDSFLIDPALSTGSFLVAAHSAGVELALPLQIQAYRLGRHQRQDGHWTTFDARPPSSYSFFTSTAIAARALSLSSHPSTASERDESLRRASQWLESHQPHSTEDSAFRLMGLVWTGANQEARRRASADLMGRQNEDGGWGQLPGEPSDAYATGLAMSALNTGHEVAAVRAAKRNGVSYLLRTQKGDGSWHVATRLHTQAPISPPYFESGFPYSRDQFISCAATAWAVSALSQWLPRAANPQRRDPVLSARPRGQATWMETAFFGTTSELAKALDSGLDVNSRTPEGTSLLMFAAHDPAKVKLLLARGADAKARSKSGYDALLVASLYQGNKESVEALLDAGLPANPPPGVRFYAKPLVHAAIAGDASMVDLLIRRGAKPRAFMSLAGIARFRPIDAAAQFEHFDVLDVLLRNGVSIDEIDDNKMTQLSWAALMHRPQTVRYLISHGANVNYRDKFNHTPQMHALTVKYAPEETLKALKDKPSLPAAQ